MVKRFVIEYANHKIRSINAEPMMQERYKEKTKRTIEDVVLQYKEELITEDEVMRIIAGA